MPATYTKANSVPFDRRALAEDVLTATRPRVKTVALIDWSQLIEDYLDNINISFAEFCNQMSGGWMFGYIEALKVAGVRTVLFCFSARVEAPERHRHRATGATICVLPAPRVYRALRRRVLNPYAATVEEAVGDVRGARRAFWSAVKDCAPYLSTPLLHLARELRRERCDALLCQDYEHGRFDLCLLLGRLMRLPVFATFQGGDRALSRLEPLLRRNALRASNGLVIASRSEASRVAWRYGMCSGSVARIFNPLDLSEWGPSDERERLETRARLGIPAGARVAAWHGRVQIEIKGLDVLLDAWERVCRARPGRELRLLIVGAGNDGEELRQRISRLQVGGVVRVEEYVRDRALMRRYLAAADVYALASRREGFPVAPVEAMACGLPVVATDARGVRDILGDSEVPCGLVVPLSDPAALAEALGRVLDDEALGRQLGARARARAESDFTPEAVGRQLRDFFVSRGMKTTGDAAPGAPRPVEGVRVNG